MIGYFLFRLLIGFISLLPWSVIYKLSNFLAWVMGSLIKYRINVINTNLEYALPDLPDNERAATIKGIYRNLTDVILESLKSYSAPLKQIHKRYEVSSSDELQAHFDEGKDVTFFAAHYGNWEWGTLTLEDKLPHHIIGLIKPVKNQRINDYIWRERGKTGTGMVSIYDKRKRLLFEKGDRPKGIVYIADQNPSKNAKALDVKLLNRPSKALHGGEVYARKYNNPVYYIEIVRVSRGHYTVKPILISNDASSGELGSLTQAYFDLLSKQLISDPTQWLWTHKRWKHHLDYKK